MLNLVGMRFGQQLAAQVSEQFILERIRSSTDTQPIPVDARVGFSRAELIEVVRLMEANIEEPLSLEAPRGSCGCRSGTCSACSRCT